MEWNVFYYNINAMKIETMNIFRHRRFAEEVESAISKSNSKESFAETVRKSLAYYFWCKSEYEVIISNWAGDNVKIKVDVYSQVMLNFDRFIDYLWSYRKVASK